MSDRPDVDRVLEAIDGAVADGIGDAMRWVPPEGRTDAARAGLVDPWDEPGTDSAGVWPTVRPETPVFWTGGTPGRLFVVDTGLITRAARGMAAAVRGLGDTMLRVARTLDRVAARLARPRNLPGAPLDRLPPGTRHDPPFWAAPPSSPGKVMRALLDEAREAPRRGRR